MPSYSGSALYAEWVYSGGTVILSGDFRKIDYTPSIDLLDETAGADPAKKRIVGVKDGQANMSMVRQAGGTALENALVEGTEGTLIWGPEGTTTGKGKKTLPAISGGVKSTQPYNNVVEISIAFTQNGSRTDGVY